MESYKVYFKSKYRNKKAERKKYKIFRLKPHKKSTQERPKKKTGFFFSKKQVLRNLIPFLLLSAAFFLYKHPLYSNLSEREKKLIVNVETEEKKTIKANANTKMISSDTDIIFLKRTPQSNHVDHQGLNRSLISSSPENEPQEKTLKQIPQNHINKITSELDEKNSSLIGSPQKQEKSKDLKQENIFEKNKEMSDHTEQKRGKNYEIVFDSYDLNKKNISLDEIGELVDEKGEIITSKSSPGQERNAQRDAVNHYRTYKVKSGDSIWNISKKFQLSIDSIISLNNIKNASAINRGEILKIPEYNGIYYTVKPYDSLEKISIKWKTRINTIKKFNSVGVYLKPGHKIFIPDARYSVNERRMLFGTYFITPVKGRLSSPYGLRIHPILNKKLFHTGIDIAAPAGTHIRAAGDGIVTEAGHNGGYGKIIKINHKNGYETLYAHLSKISLRKGQKITRGTIIGEVGSTGRSTGPHLHFEILHRKKYINPLRFVSPKQNRI